MSSLRILSPFYRRGQTLRGSTIASAFGRESAVGVRIVDNSVRTMAQGTAKSLNINDMNPNIIKLEYAVRGPLVIRAGEIEKELQSVSFNI